MLRPSVTRAGRARSRCAGRPRPDAGGTAGTRRGSHGAGPRPSELVVHLSPADPAWPTPSRYASPSSRSSAVGTVPVSMPSSHHRERDVRLDADDDGHGPAQPGHLGDVAQRAGAEGVQHVEGGDVDDHAAGPVLADLLDEVLAGTGPAGSRPGRCGSTRSGRRPVAGSRPAPVRSFTSPPAPPCAVTRVAEQPLGLLEAALQVTDGVHLAQVHPDGHQGLGDLRRQPGDDDAGTHQPGRVDGLHEVVGDRLVDVGTPR